MNKLYCRSCGFETVSKEEIKDYCISCNSTMVVIVPATYRPFPTEPETDA
jgi:predicted Zn-ribbon and HTH transcriptional regulator